MRRFTQALFFGLALTCLAFWTGADFFHFDDGPGSHPDCPVCHLDRVSNGEPAPVCVAVNAVALVPLWRLELPLATPLIEANELASPAPRGPPQA